MTLRFPNIQQVNNCVLMQQENLYLYFANITSKFNLLKHRILRKNKSLEAQIFVLVVT